MDYVTGGYSLFSALLIAIRHEAIGPQAWTYFGLHMIVVFIALVASPVQDSARHPLLQNPVMRFLRNMYAAFLLGIYYNWTEPVSRMFFSQPLDAYVEAVDVALFGYSPGVELVKRLGNNNYWLTEYMNFSYLSFYYITLYLPLYLYFKGKTREFYHVAFIMTVTMFFFCFLPQSIFPVEGPIYRYSDIGGHLHAGPISAFAASFLSGADVPGSAMPSGHIAGTVGIFFLAWTYFRKAFWVSAPIVISLCISTVYGHFHYVVDGVVGILVAVIGVFMVGPWLYEYMFPHLLPPHLSPEESESPESAYHEKLKG